MGSSRLTPLLIDGASIRVIIQMPRLFSEIRPKLDPTNVTGDNRPPHWLDALVIGVVERNADRLTTNQLLNAIMHSPPIVNAIQRALNVHAREGLIDPSSAGDFARDIRRAFVEIVETEAPPIDEPQRDDAED